MKKAIFIRVFVLSLFSYLAVATKDEILEDNMLLIDDIKFENKVRIDSFQ